jgi:hypothetical protein
MLAQTYYSSFFKKITLEGISRVIKADGSVDNGTVI